MTQRRSDRSAGRFVLDRTYFRDEARKAVRTFVAPLATIYQAFHAPVSMVDPQQER